MVDDALLARENLSDDEWSVTPKPEHLIPDSVEREQTQASFRGQLKGGPSAVVLTHIDADGLGCAALIAAAEGLDIAIQPVSYHDAYVLEDALADVYEVCDGDVPIFITDLNPDSVQIGAPLRQLRTAGHDVTWYDHHQWGDDVVEAVEQAGVELVVDEDECATTLIARELDHEFPEHIVEFAAVTKDRDLWIREDPRSDRLATFATIADTREYIRTVLEHGADLPDDVQERIDERLERDQLLESKAVERASYTDVEGYRVAFTYSRGGRSSEIGNELCENDEHDVDIAVVMKTHGGMGVYSHSDRETFARCHEVASELGGGGHPTAAGCDAPVETFRDLADYWATKGGGVPLDVVRAIEAVVSEGGDSA